MLTRSRSARALLGAALTLSMLFPAVVQASGGGGGGGGGGSPTVTALAPDTSTPAPGSSGTATVLLSGAAPSGGETVPLSSSNQAVVSVPASVTVPTGSTSAQFAYTTGPVDTATAVTLHAAQVTATITVTPATLLSVLAIPSAVQGGTTGTIRPQLTAAAPAGGIVVSLSSDTPVASLPATVTIPAGAFGVAVPATTQAVTATTIADITATYAGASVSTQLTVAPPDTPVSVGFDATGTAGTVRLANPALPNGETVTLESSDPALASVPPSIVIGFSGTAGGFTITTAAVTVPTDVTISATENGVTASGVLTLTPPPPPAPALQAITVSPGTIASGSQATATATLNVQAPAGGAVVKLASSDTTAASVPATVTVPAGATAATFTVTGLGANTTSVSIGGTYGGAGRAALLGVTGARGGTLLAPVPAGVFVEPFAFDPTPEGALTTIQMTWDGTLESFVLTTASGQLPPGMTLISPFRPLVAAITGTPTTPGTYAFVLKFTGSGGTVFGFPFVWEIDQPAPLHISQANFGPGTLGQPYDGGFFYGGGVAPYTWSISAGALPPGLKLNSSTSEVTGTPTKRGTFSFTARLTDAKKATLDTPETITVT